MPRSGLEIRAEIDVENVKGLLLANGGGAVALLAFLPGVIGKPCYAPLAHAIIAAVLSCQVGVLAALVHNRLRRLCSLVYEQQGYKPPPCRWVPFRRWRKFPGPCVCEWSIAFMWLSLIAFLVAGVIILYFGWGTISTCAAALTAPGAATSAPAPDWL
jgi:hypothetical protein